MGRAKRRATKIRHKVVGCGIFDHFANFDKCWLEVAGDVISAVSVDYVGIDVRATFGESELNSGRITWLFGLAGPVLRITFVKYLIAICSQPEAMCDIISG